MYRKQKPRLYFDENFPLDVIEHFRSPYWKKRVWTTSAHEERRLGQADRFHYTHCQRHRYTLVTLDADFNDDRRYPFVHGKTPGIIIVRASSAEVQRAANMLATLLDFVMKLPFPNEFLAETKFIVAQGLLGFSRPARARARGTGKTTHRRSGYSNTIPR